MVAMSIVIACINLIALVLITMAPEPSITHPLGAFLFAGNAASLVIMILVAAKNWRES